MLVAVALPARAQVTPPSNDNFANAITLSGASGAVNGTSVGATREAGEPGTPWGGDFSVWYSWTAVSTGTTRFDTCNNTQDPTLSIYTGNSVSALTVIAQDDDAGAGLNPQIDVAATAGTTYRIRVDEYFSGPAGSFTLRYGPTVPACSATDAPAPGQDDVASQNVGAGGAVSTDSAGDGASAADPVETSVVSPTGGTVTIEETAEITQTPPEDYTFVGQQVNITAPAASGDDPLRVDFLFDPSVVPSGNDASDLDVFRNGAAVPPCRFPGTSYATPDPCVDGRDQVGDDIRIKVVTSQASSWNAGARPPRQIDSGGSTGGGSGGGSGPAETPVPAGSAPSSGGAAGEQPPSPSPSKTQTQPAPTPVTTVTPGTGGTSSPSASPASTTSGPPSSQASPDAADTSVPTGEGSANATMISPNGDGNSDLLRVSFTFSEPVDWVFTVSDGSGLPVFTSAGDGTAAAVVWGGTGHAGIVSDGLYRWQLTATDTAGNRMTPALGPVTVDTEGPAIGAARATPDELPPGRNHKIRLSVSVEGARSVSVKIVGRDGTVARLGPKELGSDDTRATFVWEPRRLGRGTYFMKVHASDAAGNSSTKRSGRIEVGTT